MSLLIKTSADQSFWIELNGSRFLVNPISSSEDAKIAKKYIEWKNGVPIPDYSKIRKEKFVKTVLNWENVSDVEGNEVKYSEEMKENFAEYNPDFALSIIQKAEKHEVAKKEEEYENLGES